MERALRLTTIPGVDRFVLTLWTEDGTASIPAIYLPLDREAASSLSLLLSHWLKSSCTMLKGAFESTSKLDKSSGATTLAADTLAEHISEGHAVDPRAESRLLSVGLLQPGEPFGTTPVPLYTAEGLPRAQRRA